MIKYPYLPPGREIFYVPESNSFMASAIQTAQELSTDRMQPTGAVIVKEGKIIAKGANQVFLKHPILQKFHRNGFCPRKFFGIKSGTKYWLCPACSKNKDHAEAQAVLNARENNKETLDTDLYLWGHWWCCKPCWDRMIEAGIKNVFLLEGSEKLFNPIHSDNTLGKRSK